jgi:hypothetical protein
MRRLWFGLMMLAPACLPARGAAEEVIASSAPQQPVAAQTAPAPAVTPVSYWTPADQGVSLGQPRVARGAAPSLEPIAPPQLSRVPASLEQPRLLPDSATVPPPATRQPYHSEPESLFAIERADLYDDFAVVPVASMGNAGPEKIGFPQQPLSHSTIADSYAAPEAMFEEGYSERSHRNRFYGGIEYLLWWTKGDRTPPLVTTGNPNDPAQGALVPGSTTQVLFGGNLDHDVQSGARIRLGYWFDTCKPLAIEGSYFFLGKRSEGFSTPFTSNLLARPFFNLNNGIEDSEIVAFPGNAAGRVIIDAPSSLHGADANLRCNLWCMDSCWGNVKVDGLAGFRFLDLREGLHITEQGGELTPQRNPDGSLVQDVAFRITDRFDTQNRFYGGQVGLATQWQRGPWSIEGRSTLAMGVVHQVIDITGTALFFNRNGTISQERGGLLALNSNSGHFTRNRFSVVPEIGMTIGYQVTDWMKATIGYNCLVWTNVVRPGEQIDRGLDITQIPRFVRPGDPVPPPAQRPGPLVPFRESTYWAQGLTLGLEFSY